MRIRHWLLAMVLALGPAAARGAMLNAGDEFPAWKLVDHTGASVSSTDLKGQTYLLWFYPMARTPGCTAEGRALRDHEAEFKSAKVTLLGVSFDKPETNADFVRAENFPFRLLSDTDRKLAIAVGAADSTWRPVARRISYLVSGDQKVLKVYESVDPDEHAQQVLNDLKLLP